MRIGSCRPAYPPFIYDDGTGFDLVNWDRVYKLMREAIMTEGTAAQKAALGTSPPTVEFYPFDTLLDLVANSTLDVGTCGVYALPSRSTLFDFGPAYQSSGMSMVRRAGGQLQVEDVSLQVVLNGLYANIDSTAVFSLLMLLYGTLVFAHFIWFFERHYNRNVPRDYGKGIFEGMWMGIVTATTVGYGDVMPTTRPGKILGVMWIFIGTLFAAMFSAAITSSLVSAAVYQHVGTAPLVTTLDDLQRHPVGVNFQAARDAVLERYPQADVTLYATPKASYEALTNQEIAAVVDDGASAQLLTGMESSAYLGSLEMIAAETLDLRQSVLVISRIDGQTNPLFRPLVFAQLEVLIRDGGTSFVALKELWFGKGNAFTELDRIRTSKKNFYEGVSRINWIGFGFLLGIIVLWALLIVAKDWKQWRRSQLTSGLRTALGISRKFSRDELREACDALFEKLDDDQSGSLDVEELAGLLDKMGRHMEPDELHAFFGGAAHEAGVGMHRSAGAEKEHVTAHPSFLDELKFTVTSDAATASIENRVHSYENLGTPEEVQPEVHITKESFFHLVMHILQSDAGPEEETLDDPVSTFQVDVLGDDMRRQLRDMERRLEKRMEYHYKGVKHYIHAKEAKTNDEKPHAIIQEVQEDDEDKKKGSEPVHTATQDHTAGSEPVDDALFGVPRKTPQNEAEGSQPVQSHTEGSQPVQDEGAAGVFPQSLPAAGASNRSSPQDHATPEGYATPGDHATTVVQEPSTARLADSLFEEAHPDAGIDALSTPTALKAAGLDRPLITTSGRTFPGAGVGAAARRQTLSLSGQTVSLSGQTLPVSGQEGGPTRPGAATEPTATEELLAMSPPRKLEPASLPPPEAGGPPRKLTPKRS